MLVTPELPIKTTIFLVFGPALVTPQSEKASATHGSKVYKLNSTVEGFLVCCQ